jgi:hypothetical protein
MLLRIIEGGWGMTSLVGCERRVRWRGIIEWVVREIQLNGVSDDGNESLMRCSIEIREGCGRCAGG